MKNKIREYKAVLITALLTTVLIVSYIFFESKSDILGYSAVETNLIRIAGILTDIILPLVLLTALVTKNRFLLVLLLSLRSILYVFPLCIYAKAEGNFRMLTIFTVAVSVIYVLILVLYGTYKLSFAKILILIIGCRLAIMFLNGSLAELVFGWSHGSYYLIPNTLHLAATELLFVIPLCIKYMRPDAKSHSCVRC